MSWATRRWGQSEIILTRHNLSVNKTPSRLCLNLLEYSQIKSNKGDPMPHKVTAKQHNSRMCFVCGLKNSSGLHASFYEVEGDQLVALFTPCEEHQGYPDRMHGGLAATILDETIGRAMNINQNEIWGVTVEFNVRYKKPVPLDVELRVVGRITNQNRRLFEGTGEILLPSGEVAVEGRGKYIKLPLNEIADFDYEEQEWKAVPEEGDPEEIELP
jgi:acyl-coenzyme A thioesterase PaaI-like protein